MADPRGFSIARWTPPDQGSVILDSDTYINDIGILTASSLISEGALTIIAQSGAQLALLPNIDQETNITLVLPDTAGTQGNYLRIDTITQIGNVTKIGLDWAPGDGSGTVTSVGLTTSTSGLTISNTPITSAGNIGIALNTELQGLSTIASNGIIARTTAGTYTPRTITAGSGNIAITNGDGISGNPTVNLNTSLTGLTALSTTNINVSNAATINTINMPANGHTLALNASSSQTGDMTITLPSQIVPNGYLKVDANGATAWAPGDGSGTVTSVATSTTSTGIVLSGSPITTSGTLSIDLNGELQGVAVIKVNGFIARTSTGTYTARAIVAEDSNISVTNGDGIAGNASLTLNTTLTNMVSITTQTLNASESVSTGDLIANGDITATNTIAGGQLESQGNITAVNDIIAQGEITGNLLNLATAVTNKYLTFISSTSQTDNIQLTFPSDTGSNGQVLATDGTGALSWKSGNLGTVTSVGLTTSTSGLTISNTPITSAGNISIALNTELQGLSTIATNGIVARTNTGTYTPRTITAGSANIAITNGDGISGNPTVNLNTNLTGLNNIDVTTINISANGHTLSIAGSNIQSEDYTLTMPVTHGTAGQFISTNGTAGVLSWNNAVTSITAGTGLSGGTITGIGSIALANTAVTAGSYARINATVDAQGRLTAASAGTNSGQATLTASTPYVVTNSAVTSTSVIILTPSTGASVPDFSNMGTYAVGSIVDNTSFTIYASNPLDTSTINWELLI